MTHGQIAINMSAARKSARNGFDIPGVPDAASYSSSSEARLPCSFCGEGNARAAVVLDSLARKPLCLLHYHTTRSIRFDPAKVRPAGDGSELRRQLPDMQELFSEAYTDLKRDIAEESARAFAASAADPLGSMLHDAARRGGGQPRTQNRQRRRPVAASESTADERRHETEGGFIRDVALPERYVTQQRKQQRNNTIESSSSSSSGKKPPPPVRKVRASSSSILKVQSNPYKRRKQRKASIWNLALENPDDGGGADGAERSAAASSWENVEKSMAPTVTCSCGSKDVQTDGNVSGRGGDTHKGETWGNKDRSSEVVIRYQCLRCGKAWNEEE